MNEERMRILKMIQDGQISAEEGARLLEALGGETNTKVRPTAEWESGSVGGKTLRIKVFDSVTQREKVNLTVPLALARMVSSFIPESQRDQLESHGIHLEDVLRAVESGKVGKVVDLTDNDRDEHVEISVE